jgi:hypothetical protein
MIFRCIMIPARIPSSLPSSSVVVTFDIIVIDA